MDPINNKGVVLFIDEQVSSVEAICDKITTNYNSESFVHFKTVEEGLEYLSENSKNVCCISMDLLMPISYLKDYKTKYRLEGLNALTLLRKTYPSIPMICYSFVQDNEAKEVIDSLNVPYLKKVEHDSYDRLWNYIEECFQKYKKQE